jgi:CDP-diacylglycerol---glycerol-3-phosphate 3-phosphatidyltransferase
VTTGRIISRGETAASNANIANLITIARILLAPLFFVMLLVDAGQFGALRYWAAGLFVFAIATDSLDGYLARSRNLVTDLGKMLDPIADKVLIGGALIALSLLGELWWWVTILILLRELGITVYRFFALRNRVIPATWSGKLKTIAQAIALTLMLFPFWLQAGDVYRWAGWIMMGLALAFTLYSGAVFLYRAWSLDRAARA